MAKYKDKRKSYSSLVIALLLLGSFALLFYRNLLTKENNIPPSKNSLVNVEKLMIENSDKKNSSDEEKINSDSFTFYSTLTKEAKKIERIKDVDVQKEPIKSIVNDRKSGSDSSKEHIEKSAFKNISEKDLAKKLYTVQLASFKEFDKADDLALALKRKGYLAYIQASNLNDNSVRFRVRTGKFADLDEAKKFSNNLNEKEKFKSIVVRE